MVESGGIISQAERDRKLGIPKSLWGILSAEAQRARQEALIRDKVPAPVAQQTYPFDQEDIAHTPTVDRGIEPIRPLPTRYESAIRAAGVEPPTIIEEN